LKEDFVKISNVLRINEPQTSSGMPTLEEIVNLVAQVQREEMLEKVKKLERTAWKIQISGVSWFNGVDNHRARL
jgi:hypothetical protein